MFLRNGIIAAVVALFAAWGFCLATMGTIYLASPIAIYLSAPIPVILLVASRLRVGDWLLERVNWRGRIRATVSIVVPLAVLWIAFIVFRVVEIPFVDHGFAIDEFVTKPMAEERRTAELYRQALDRIPEAPHAERGTDAYNQWLDSAAAGIGAAIDTSRREACMLLDPARKTSEIAGYDNRFGLGQIVIDRGDLCLQRGDLDESLEHYLAALRMARHFRNKASWHGHLSADQIEAAVYSSLNQWAAHEDQTSEQIRRGMDQVVRWTRDLASRSSSIKFDYLFQRSLVEDFNDARQAIFGTEQQPLFYGIDYVPWEAMRTRRLINTQCQWNLESLRAAEGAIKNNVPHAKIIG
ncbi:MAG: hypothetical protein QGF59_30125, partial [Pirellulaceae bacterium]|nr:hypothetical protein [Pirellulaceae bacterium]